MHTKLYPFTSPFYVFNVTIYSFYVMYPLTNLTTDILNTPCLCSHLLRIYCDSLVVSYFLDFSCSLKSYLSVFSFEVAITSFSLYCLTERKIHFISPAIGILRLFQPFYGLGCSALFAPSYSRVLKFIYLLWSLQTRPNTDSLPFALPSLVLNA